jgi:hypothetical protein
VSTGNLLRECRLYYFELRYLLFRIAELNVNKVISIFLMEWEFW